MNMQNNVNLSDFPYKSVNIKRNKSGSFDVKLSHVPKDLINQLMMFLKQGLDGQALPSTALTNQAPNNHVKNTENIKQKQVLTLAPQVKKVLMVKSTCDKHNLHFGFKYFDHLPCLLCIKEEVDHVSTLRNQVYSADDFTEYAQLLPHLDQKNAEQEGITIQAIRHRYMGGLSQRLGLLKKTVSDAVISLIPECSSVGFNFVESTLASLKLYTHQFVELPLHSLFPTDEHQKDHLAHLMFKLTDLNYQIEFEGNTASNLDKSCDQCFRCVIDPILANYMDANEAHKAIVNKHTFNHATPIDQKRKIQNERKPFKLALNKCADALNSELINFNRTIPNPHPTQCYLKIDPKTNVVRYKKNDGTTIEVKIPHSCDSSSNKNSIHSKI